MSIRIVRHLGARSAPADDVKALILVPTFPGEKVKAAMIDAYFASGDSSAIDQPGELNWKGISIPWQLAFTTDLLDGGSGINTMGTVAEYDKLFRQWMKGGDDDYYGGDVDADPEVITGEEGHDTTGTDAEELIDSGPIGVHTWFSRERLMTPLAAEGNTVIRFGDRFNAHPTNIPTASMGSLLIFGIVRQEHAAETNFNIEFDDATSREGMGLLMSGDYTKAGAMVEGNTAALGDFIRTVLYGGDNFIEADTLKGPAGKAIVKARFVIETKMGREHKR